LKEEESFPVVVVSAMSGVTDQLLRIARYACANENDACAQELVALRKKHLGLPSMFFRAANAPICQR
jgi:aspartate kinase